MKLLIVWWSCLVCVMRYLSVSVYDEASQCVWWGISVCVMRYLSVRAMKLFSVCDEASRSVQWSFSVCILCHILCIWIHVAILKRVVKKRSDHFVSLKMITLSSVHGVIKKKAVKIWTTSGRADWRFVLYIHLESCFQAKATGVKATGVMSYSAWFLWRACCWEIAHKKTFLNLWPTRDLNFAPWLCVLACSKVIEHGESMSQYSRKRSAIAQAWIAHLLHVYQHAEGRSYKAAWTWKIQAL